MALLAMTCAPPKRDSDASGIGGCECVLVTPELLYNDSACVSVWHDRMCSIGVIDRGRSGDSLPVRGVDRTLGTLATMIFPVNP